MDPAAKRSKLLQMRVNAAELDLIKRAAHLDQMTPPVWVREMAKERAGERLKAGPGRRDK